MFSFCLLVFICLRSWLNSSCRTKLIINVHIYAHDSRISNPSTSLASNVLSGFLSSPVNVPFVKEEPFFGLWQVDMHVLVDAADNKDLVVVAHRLRSEELLWLFQAAFHALDLANLCVQREAVTDPAVVTAEDQDLRVVKREASHSVAR